MPSDDTRSAFAGGDQEYLRSTQYGTGEKLDVRSRLHLEFGTADATLAEFEARLIDWPTHAAVLECGCGTGRFWDAGIAPSTIALTLTDLSPGMVTEARARAEANSYRVADAHACDVQSLPFADDSYDVVIANHMLYHVPDPDLALTELARVLRPGGVFVAATNGNGHMDVIKEIVSEALVDHEDGLYDVFGIDVGERRLRERFASIAWHAYVNDLVVDDDQAVIDYVLSFPPGEHADAGGRAAVADAVARRFVDGAVRIRTRAGVFVCRQPR